MYIIDNNRDFYDYVSHIYGVDKKIIFDRRDSIKLNNESILDVISDPWMRTGEEFVLLEIGTTQHLFRIYDILYNDRKLKYFYKIERIHTYREHKNLFKVPISISYCFVRTPFFFMRHKPKRRYEIPSFNDLMEGRKKILNHSNKERMIIKLPVIADTRLTKFLDPVETWSEIQNYISSLDNDKDVSIEISDKEKANIHGFDKHSFRHPVKTEEIK
jgi:hypothetical protein